MHLGTGLRCASFIALVMAAACGGEEPEPPVEADGSGAAVVALQANPCDAGPAVGIADSAVARFLTGADRLDAEVYDCQRMVLATGTVLEFGPLVGVYPVDATLDLPR